MADNKLREGIEVEFGAKLAPMLGGITLAKAAVAGFASFGAIELGRFARAALDTSRKYETAMAEISTISTASRRELGAMRKEMGDLAVTFGQDFQKVARARYDVISSGFTGVADSMKIMQTAAKSAVAGLTDIAVAAKATTLMLNAYELDAKDAARVGDLLFGTVKVGVTTYEELAQNLGDVASTGKAARVSMEELLGLIATVTLGGVSVPEAVTAVNQFLLAFVSPGKEAKKVINELGLTLDDGLAPALEKVSKLADDDLEALAKMLPSVRALKAGLTGAADGGRRFDGVMREIRGSAGMTDEAFGKMAETSEHLSRQIKAAGDEVKAAWGELFREDVDQARGGLLALLGVLESIAVRLKEIKGSQALSSAMMGAPMGGSGWNAVRVASQSSPAAMPPLVATGPYSAYLGVSGPQSPLGAAPAAATRDLTFLAEAARAAAQATLEWNLRQYGSAKGASARGVVAAGIDATSGMSGRTDLDLAGLGITPADRAAEAGLGARRDREHAATYEQARQKTQALYQTASVLTNNLSGLIESGIYGSLVNAFGGGESAMARFAASTLSQLSAIIVRATILKAVLSALGLPMLESGGYAGGALPGYAWGGYTGGAVGGGGVAGVVHSGEYVLNRRATSAVGVHNLDRINRGGDVLTINGGLNVTINGTQADDERRVAAAVERALPLAIRDAQRSGRIRTAYEVGRN